MEEDRFPITVADYCSEFDIPLKDLKLRCVFCKFYLTEQQLAAFCVKNLKLVWKNRYCFACCTPCLRLTAKFEAENYFQCMCKGEVLEVLTRIPLSSLSIRCLDCLTLLSFAEKIDCIIGGQNFYLVRGRWRSYCRNCIEK